VIKAAAAAALLAVEALFPPGPPPALPVLSPPLTLSALPGKAGYRIQRGKESLTWRRGAPLKGSSPELMRALLEGLENHAPPAAPASAKGELDRALEGLRGLGYMVP
jgi:hypothetical protein